ncbi:MAG: hypothetical protein V3U02_10730 [Calditrichia bacterium]
MIDFLDELEEEATKELKKLVKKKAKELIARINQPDPMDPQKNEVIASPLDGYEIHDIDVEIEQSDKKGGDK